MLKKMPGIFLLIILAIGLVGCTNFPLSAPSPTPTPSPSEIYKLFWEACNIGDIATAESLVTEDGVIEAGDYGVCVTVAHDGFDRFLGQTPDDFLSDQPEVEIAGNTAYLTWQRKGSGPIKVILYNTEEGWRLRESRIFDN